MCLAVDLELGEHTIELLCVVGSLRPHSIMRRGWADKVQGYKGGWGVIKMKSYLVIQLTLYPIPYTLYPICDLNVVFSRVGSYVIGENTCS